MNLLLPLTLGIVGLLFVSLLGIGFVVLCIIIIYSLMASKGGQVNSYCSQVEERLMKINPVHPALGRFKKSVEGVVREARANKDAGRARVMNTLLPDAVRAYEAMRRKLDEKKEKEAAGQNAAEVDKQIQDMADAFVKLSQRMETMASQGVMGATDEEAADMIRTLANM